MNIYAKLINGQLTYSTNFEKIGDNWVSNPTEEQLKAAGYKIKKYEEVDEITTPFNETDDEIIVYIQKAIINDTVETPMQETYNTEPVMQKTKNISSINNEIVTESVTPISINTVNTSVKKVSRFSKFLNNITDTVKNIFT